MLVSDAKAGASCDRCDRNPFDLEWLEYAGGMAGVLGVAHDSILRLRDLAFAMSGGPKGAKLPLERPLDGGVKRLRSNVVPGQAGQWTEAEWLSPHFTCSHGG